VWRVGGQHAFGLPLAEGLPCPSVPIPGLDIAWKNEPDGVLRVCRFQPCPAFLVDDVVRRSSDGAEVGAERAKLIAEAGKGEEVGHHGGF
jgi:hypothetical protein